MNGLSSIIYEIFGDIDWGATSAYIVQCLKALPAAPIYIMMLCVGGLSFILCDGLGLDVTAVTDPIMAFLSYIGESLIIP